MGGRMAFDGSATPFGTAVAPGPSRVSSRSPASSTTARESTPSTVPTRSGPRIAGTTGAPAATGNAPVMPALSDTPIRGPRTAGRCTAASVRCCRR